MDKYIKLEDAITTLKKYFPLSFDRQDAEDDLKSIPAADVEEVKHGEIIKTGRRYPYCSECKCNLYDGFYRCPWCGAKFDEKESGDGRTDTD